MGHFWGAVETRPYMRARLRLARHLWELGEHDKAISHYREMLKLNTHDNQGIRYILLSSLGQLGRFDEMAEILDLPDYRNDCAAEWVYAKALLAFRKEGASARSASTLRKAVGQNPFVPVYLLGKKKIPKILPDRITMGGEDEAFSCAAEFMETWKKVPGALEWLAQETASSPTSQALPLGRNELCFCGSGKKFKKCCLPKIPTR